MSLALIAAGLLLVIAAVRNSQGDLFTLVAGEFKGPNNFIEWILAFVLIGAIGFIPKLKPVSVALLALIIVGIFVKKGTGFFDSIASASQSLNK